MCKSGTVNNPKVIDNERDTRGWNLLPAGDEISLRKPLGKGTTLNDVETSLLGMFDDVLINSKFPKCYFVVKGKNIGVCKLDGTLVVPPVPGRPRKIFSVKGLIVGDSAPFDDYLFYFTNASGRKRQACCGEFYAVLDEKTLDPVIPFGKYNYITLTLKGMKKFYYVAMAQDGEYLWGVVDGSGNEILPCAYRSVYVDNKEYAGDNSTDMFERLNGLRQKMARYQERMNLANTVLQQTSAGLLEVAGQAVKLDQSLKAARAMAQAASDTPSDETATTAASNGKKGKNRDYEPKYDLSEQENYNSDKRAYANYDSMLAKYFSGTGSASVEDAKEWQQKMKSLRTKWEKRGKNFPKSGNESRSLL